MAYNDKKRPRHLGAGPLRLETEVEFTENLYSMFFASCLKHEYIYYHKEILPQIEKFNDEQSEKASQE